MDVSFNFNKSCNVILVYWAKIGMFLFFYHKLKMNFDFVLLQIIERLVFEIGFHFHFWFCFFSPCWLSKNSRCRILILEIAVTGIFCVWKNFLQGNTFLRKFFAGGFFSQKKSGKKILPDFSTKEVMKKTRGQNKAGAMTWISGAGAVGLSLWCVLCGGGEELSGGSEGRRFFRGGRGDGEYSRFVPWKRRKMKKFVGKNNAIPRKSTSFFIEATCLSYCGQGIFRRRKQEWIIWANTLAEPMGRYLEIWKMGGSSGEICQLYYI